jgi:membrane protein YdbS with pleckstrin-like domain
MALIACPECGREVSTAAKVCPACGYPVAEKLPVADSTSSSDNELLAEIRPSWWRYFWWLCFAWLIIPFIVAWVKRSAVVLRIYRGRITLERGLLNKCESEFFMRDVRAIDIDQSFGARLVGIGDITISTAATVEGSERIEGIPNPQAIRDLIIAQRQGH